MPADAPAPNVVETYGLHVTLRRNGEDLHVLRGVDLTIATGEIVGIVGESGSGKSVLGLALMGLLPAASSPRVDGAINVCGVDLGKARKRARRNLLAHHVGAVFQDPMTSLNPTMRVGRQLAEKCGSMDEAARLLDAVRVPEARQRLRAYPHELSGGLRQRVMIAMAVSGNPQLVIADEPTTALDVTVQSQILELLVDLRDELGTAFMFVTHDLGVAAQIADRIGVMYGGGIVELGTAAAVLDDPAHPYTQGLLRSRITMDRPRGVLLSTLAGGPPDPRRPDGGCPFEARCMHRLDECASGSYPPLPVPTDHTRRSACPVVGPGVQVADVAGRKLADVTDRNAAPAVSLRGVEKHFPVGRRTLQAVRGVDLDVAPGEAVALVGESGCGKSTLLRLISGLIPPSSGEVVLADTSTRPQMIFQDAGASLTPWMSVGELVGERLRGRDMDRTARDAKVRETLDIVGLPESTMATRAAELSGGQRQRVGVARAIVVPPPVLLCDEPTSALDASLAAIVLNMLNELRRELGMAMVFVTHDLAAARIMADRIAVMYLGRIVEEGAVDAITEHPTHPYTRALLRSVPRLGQARIPVFGEPASPLDPPVGCAFHTRCPDAIDACQTTDPQFDGHVACLRAGELAATA